MAKRGKVLRDPYLGPGLLMVEGKQYPFLMEGLWRSEVPAKPGLIVNVDFDTQGNLNGITAIPQAQLDQERELERGIRNGGIQSRTRAKGSLIQIVAVGLLAACWLFLTAISIHLPVFGDLDMTFWQVLGLLNSGNPLQSLEVSRNPDSGMFGFVAILVLAGPLLRYLWKDPRALLGGILPLSFMTLIAYRVGVHLAAGPQITPLYTSFPTNPRDGIFGVLSVGLGSYLSLSLAIYLAVLGTQQFMQSRHLRELPLVHSQKAAA